MTTNFESLSLTQLFGEGAFQNPTTIVIQKASLAKLTPTVNNSAESLLAAILITALANFKGVISSETFDSITDEHGQPITFDNSETFELIKMSEWEKFQFIRSNQKYINNQIIIEQYSVNAAN